MKALSKVVRGVKRIAGKKSPTILVVAATGGFVTTIFLTARSTIKAVSILEQELQKEAKENGEDFIKDGPYFVNGRLNQFSLRDKVELTWKCYIAPASVGLFSIACLIGAHRAHLRANATLASLLGMTEAAYQEFRDKTAEIFGKKKTKEIKEEIIKDHIAKIDSTNKEVVIVEGGNSLCMENLTGRVFRSDINSVKKIINDMNFRVINGGEYISMNELFYELGLPSTSTGDGLGWVAEHPIEPTYTSALTSDGQPCLAVNFEGSMPKVGFSNLHNSW